MSSDQKLVFFDFPHFETEAEEAEWWDTHQDEVDELFARAYREGALRLGGAARQLNGAEFTLQVPLDGTTARRLMAAARRQGIGYKAYVKLLIEGALKKEKAG